MRDDKRLVKILTWVSLAQFSLNVVLFFVSWPFLQRDLQARYPDIFGAPKRQTSMETELVTITKVKQRPLSRRLVQAGLLRAGEVVSLTPQISGRLQKILFTPGQSVKEGDVLIQLDDRQAKAEMRQALAELRMSKAKYERAEALVKKNYGSPAALEQAQAEYEKARANLEKAQVALSQTKLEAPFSGLVGFKTMSPGSNVRQDQELVTIVKPDPMEVEFSIAETYVKDIAVGQDVTVKVEGFDVLPIEGKIKAIEPFADPISHNMKVKAEIPNKDGEFKAGAFARVTLTLAKDESAIVIPDKAVMRSADQESVFIYYKGRVEQITIATDPGDGEFVKVNYGLEPGMFVVVDGKDRCFSGMPVRVELDKADADEASSQEAPTESPKEVGTDKASSDKEKPAKKESSTKSPEAKKDAEAKEEGPKEAKEEGPKEANESKEDKTRKADGKTGKSE